MRFLRSFLFFALTASALPLLAQRDDTDANVRSVTELEMRRYQILRQQLDGPLDATARPRA